MANLREIKTRMKSIRETQQITNAMYMISSSKLQKAKIALENTVPYFETLKDTIACILQHMSDDITDIYFNNLEGTVKNPERRGYIIITADKGLAGAYNLNVLKAVSAHLSDNVKSRLFVVGEVGRQYFKHKNIKIVEDFNFTANRPSMNRARRITERVLDMYKRNKLDEVYIIYTKIKNGAACETVMDKLLPLHRPDFTELKNGAFNDEGGELCFYPSETSVLHAIIPNYLAGYVYGTLIESFCSEQNSRMMAMQAANESAADMLKELDIVYNRARQAAITQEINEVIGGAKVLLKKKKKKEEGKLYG